MSQFNNLVYQILNEGIENPPFVVYPGRFQFFHKAHARAFDYIKQKFPNSDVRIATTNKVDPPRSPFNFNQKTQMMIGAGIDPGEIIQVQVTYAGQQYRDYFNAESQPLIFAVGQKDMEINPRFDFSAEKDAEGYFLKKRDKQPAYIQQYWPGRELRPGIQHAYIFIIPTLSYTILGQKMNSATSVRQMFVAHPEQQDNILNELYPHGLDPNLKQELVRALTGN